MPKDNIEASQKKPRSSFLKSLPKTQRNSFIFLSILSVGILALWFWQINYRLSSTFGTPVAAPKSLAQETQEFKQLATLDTDGDGLTDVEEMTIYNTSPYLADTDGDGISDYNEVASGTDPLCAEGASCNNEIAIPKSPQDNIIISPDLDFNQSKTEPDDLETLMELMMNGEASAQDIRTIMLANGAEAELINSLSDEEILATYKESLNQQEPLEE